MRLRIEAPNGTNINNNNNNNNNFISAPTQPASASPNLCQPSYLHTCNPFEANQMLIYQQQQSQQQHYQSGNSLGGTTSPSILQLSQPSSPLRDLQTPLTASPSFGDTSPFSTMPSSSSIAEENNGFFNLQKDVELRKTLASLMVDHEPEVIQRWSNAIDAELGTRLFSEDLLKTLLEGIRNYLLQKDAEMLGNVLRNVGNEIGHEQKSQLTVAMYLFPNSVHPALKHRGIKPHWMFSLDDLIRSGVQAALNLLAPEQPAHNMIQEADKQYGQNVAAAIAAATANVQPLGVETAGIWNIPELNQQHAFYADQIRR